MNKKALEKFSDKNTNNKEPKMDKPGLFRRIGNWFKRVFTAEKAPVRRALSRVKKAFRPAYDGAKKVYDYVVPPLVNFNRWMTIGVGIAAYLSALIVNPISTVAFTLVIGGGVAMYALLQHVLETSESDAAHTVAKAMGYVVRAIGIACEVAVAAFCLTVVAVSSAANNIWLFFTLALYVATFNEEKRRKALRQAAVSEEVAVEAESFRGAASA